MAGRHQAQYTRYASSNPSYPNTTMNNNSNGGGNNNNSLGVPFSNNNAQQGHGSYSSQSGSSYNTTTPTMTSPYSTTSSPGHHSPNMQRYNTHNNPKLRKYTLSAPLGLPPLSKTMPNLGHPGIYPQRPTQVEDIMTESNVRTGFIDRPAVSNEHTCAYDMVYSKLQDDQRVLDDLGTFAVDVLKRKRNAARIIGQPSFRPPMRSTLIESKKELWMNELASGTQPLRKMARNVPHGFKGEKLLETLAGRQVPFLRAAWYIKVVGLSEMHQRNANNNTQNVSHACQWTQVVISHLRRQIAELSPSQSSNATNNTGRGYKNHPSTPSNYHDNASKPWATPENRERFEQKWSYSTKLTKWQYCEGLLDQRTFLKWTLDALATSTSFEAMWLLLTFIVQDYVDEYRRNRTLMKLLIETLIKAYGALVQQLGQLPNEGLLDIYRDIQKYIERLLQSLFLSTPDIFVIPKLYHQYRHLFDAIFGDESRKDAATVLPDVAHVMQKYWAMVKARNEIFCGTLEENQLRLDGNCSSKHIVNPSTETRQESDETRRTQVNEDHIIRTLDSIGRNIDSGTGLLIDENGWMDLRGQTAPSATNTIFSGVNKDVSTMQQRVNIMCRWATSDSRHGDWRSYLVGSILLHWRDQNPDRKTLLQDVLIHFLDTQMDSEEDAAVNDMMTDTANDPKPAVVLLFDTLIRLHLFSYQKYILRLIARGDLEPRRRHESSTVRCLNYLASFPLLTPAPAYLVNQRRVAIYGTRNGQMNGIEDQVLAQLKRLTKRALAVSGLSQDDDLDSLFGPDATSLTQPDTDDSLETTISCFTDTFDQEITQLMRSATRYTILNFTSEWLVPELKRFVVKSVPIGEDNWRVMTSPGSCLLNVRQYVTIIKILEYAKDYLNIIEVALWVLEKTNERTLYSFTIDTLRRHASIWKLVNNGKRVAEAVWAKHQSLQNRGTRERCLMMYMIQLIQEGYRITDDMRAQLQQDLHFKPKVRQYPSRNDASLTTELRQLIQSPNPSSVHNTIDSVCSQTQNTSHGLYSMFTAVFETLQHYGQERQINTLAASPDIQEHKEEIYEFRRRMCMMVDFIKGVADQSTLTGQLDDAVIQWLSQQCSPLSATRLDDLHESHTWLPLFLALLVTRRLICIDMVLKHFVLPWFEVISREAQQRCESQWTETTAETRPLRQLCKNLIDLVRMLVVQDRCWPPSFSTSTSLSASSSSSSSSESQPSQHHNNHHAYGPWVLRADEIFQLQVQRQPQLATNLDKLDYMFGLVRNSITIVSNLPYSSLLIQDLLKLRSDLLQLEWFRRACTRDVNSIYHHFATQHHSAAGGEGEIRKKMLSIVDELIGGDMHIDQDCQDSMVPTDLLEPDFGQRLQAVFANLSQWNEEQCRVQLNLLLDNIMINQHHNPHAGTTGATSSSTTAPGTQDTTTDSMVIDTSPAPTSTVVAGTSSSVSDHGESNKELDLFVKFFFDAVLASASDTETQQQNAQRRFDFLINLIHGLREPILLALLNHGVRMLEGNHYHINSNNNNNNNSNNTSEETSSTTTTTTATFPYTILLTCSSDHGLLACESTSTHYGQRCQAFYLIMQHLLAKDVWSNEKKIELVQTLFRQVEQFKGAMHVYKVMENVHHVSFADASRALQQAKSVEVAVTLLKTEGLPENEVISSSSSTNHAPSVMLQDIRISLLLRLRLMVPFVSLIWEHPREDECDILEWIKVLVPLLGNPIVHGNGSQERMFEFVLDLASLLIDEVPKDLRKTNLLHLSAMHSELSGVPSMLHCRVKRILPFLTHNIYLSNTRLASSLLGIANATDPQQQQQHLELSMEQSKPWEWLEDYASEQPHDNDTPISFSLFHGRKTKKTENTYIRWYHFGFGDSLPSLADEDDDTMSIHVGMVGHRPSLKRRKKQRNEQDSTTMENGIKYKVDGAKPQQQTLLQQKQHPQHQNKQSTLSSSSSGGRQDMEDGELP